MTLDRRRVVWMAGAALAALLVYAWIDGGERPIERITVPVELPEGAR